MIFCKYDIILCNGGLVMIKPDLIIRTNRRSLSLTISKNGELVVRAPKRLGLDYIMNFIKEKEKWIDRKRKEICENNLNNKAVMSYNAFLFFGKQYKKSEQDGLKKVELSSNSIVFPKCENMTELIKHAQNFYISISKDVLKNRVEYFADLMQLNYAKIMIMDNKRRWGACTSSATLKFNYRLSMLPYKIIDYIIIHELAHLIEFNHSDRFYKIIESIMPDYRKYRKQLKSYDFVLGLLR